MCIWHWSYLLLLLDDMLKLFISVMLQAIHGEPPTATRRVQRHDHASRATSVIPWREEGPCLEVLGIGSVDLPRGAAVGMESVLVAEDQRRPADIGEELQ
jgi:hypothetical protein